MLNRRVRKLIQRGMVFNRKWVHLSAAVLCFAAAAYGQNLTGRWVGQASQYDNGLEFVLAVNQGAGGALTGYIQGGRFNDTITGGKLEGNTVTLEAERPGRGGGAPQKITYNAVLEGGKLKLTMPAFGGRGPGRGAAAGGPPPAPRPPQVFELTRVSTEKPEPLPARAPMVKLDMPGPVKNNGLAKTPPMGWNSWNKFQGQVTDAMVREMADAIVKSGMRDAGYIYVNIDDTWESGHRDAQENIGTNNKFPDMKKLSDYIHSKGLKLGIYSSPGPRTCAGYLGSYQHEEQDAKMFAKWGIDYLKYDWCSAAQVYENDKATMANAYAKMGQALLASGRPIVYSLCQYGMHDVGEWGALVGGNLWRTTGDIRDSWDSMSHIGFDQQPGREKFANPGHWNDPDMLEIGNGHMTDTEYETHMSLWSILAAPLLAGNDIRDMKPSIAAILMNKEVIAVDQDKLGKQGTRVSKDGDLEVWSKPLADGGYAVGLFNRGAAAAKVTAKFSDIGVTGSHKLRDLWKHEDIGSKSGEYSAEVPSHGVLMVKIAK
jgi:alpha-galactosidase